MVGMRHCCVVAHVVTLPVGYTMLMMFFTTVDIVWPRENPTAWYPALFNVTHPSCVCILQWPASVGNPKSLVSQQHGSAVSTLQPSRRKEMNSTRTF